MDFEQIEKNRIDSNRLWCLALIDPDVKNEGKLDQIISNINNSNFSGILVNNHCPPPMSVMPTLIR